MIFPDIPSVIPPGILLIAPGTFPWDSFRVNYFEIPLVNSVGILSDNPLLNLPEFSLRIPSVIPSGLCLGFRDSFREYFIDCSPIDWGIVEEFLDIFFRFVNIRNLCR